ncbi:TPA_asm: integrase [Powellomyces chytrid fungus MELD virus 2]|nr:TPA_asm: integrase [Powellomyces chytrid fungus MELD virus 2]
MSFIPLNPTQEAIVAKVYARFPFGRDRLVDAVQNEHLDFKGSKRAVLYWLKSQESWQSQNKPTTKRSTIAPLQITKPGYLQLDNVSMRTYSDNGYIAFTHMIDGFTKKTYARPLRSEEEKETVNAIESMLDEMKRDGKKVSIIQSDNGSTFQAQYRDLLEKRGIKYTYSAPGRPQSNAFVERRGGDIKAALYRLMEMNGDKKWVSRFQGVIDSINQSKSLAIGMSPNELEAGDDEAQPKAKDKIVSRIASRYTTQKMMRGIYIGQKVRTRRILQSSVKKPGLLGYWNKEIYTVVQRIKSTHANFLPSYRLVNSSGVVQKGRFARTDLLEIPPILSSDRMESMLDEEEENDEEEISVADQPNDLLSKVTEVNPRRSLRIQNIQEDNDDAAEYEINFILGRRKYRGKRQYKVRYSGYGAEDDQWRDEKELLTLAPELVAEYENLH